MIWLTWRQFRAQGAIALAALMAFAALLAVTGPQLASLYATSGISGCHDSTCVQLANAFLGQLISEGPYLLVYLLSIAVILVTPAVIGMFWGAPLLAREFETGTYYLAWNQSITRTRWLVVNLAVVGLGAMAVTQAFSLMLAWWAAPITSAISHGAYGGDPLIEQNQYGPLVFATLGITPLAYAAFALALGVAAGFLIRRTVPAMALTVAIYLVFQFAMPQWIRPHLFPPERTITTFSSVVPNSADGHTGVSAAPGAAPPSPPLLDGTGQAHQLDRQPVALFAMGTQRTLGLTAHYWSGQGSQPVFGFTAHYWSGQPEAWILSSGAIDAAGNPVTTPLTACLPVDPPATLNCMTSHGIRVAITYQPASRYWAFQGTEAAIYLSLALTLVGYCFWRLNRRLT